MADKPKRTGRKPTPKRRTESDGTVRVYGKAGNGEGSVYWSPGAQRWEAKAHHPLLGKRIKRTGSTREVALQRLNEALAEAEASRRGPLGPNPTFSTLLDYFVTKVSAPRVAATTMTTYKKQAATLTAMAGSRPVRAWGKAEAQVLTTDLFEKHSHDYAMGCKRLARRAMGEAIDLGYLASNPFDRVSAPHRPERTFRTLDLEDHRKLVREALEGEYRHGVAVALLFTNALRVSEVLGLRWEDIDYDNSTLTIARSVAYLDGHGPLVKDPKTKATKGQRHLPKMLHAPLRKLHKQQLERRLALGPYLDPEGDGFVFVGTRGQLVNRQAIGKEIRRVCEGAGIDPTGVATHTGRRTFITNAFQDGLSPDDIAAVVGHADPNTTRGYVQSFGERPHEAARRIADLLAGTEA